MFRTRLAAAALAAGVGFALVAQQPAPPPHDPTYVDDEKLFDSAVEKLTALAKAGKCLPDDALKDKLKPGRVRAALAKPGDAPLAPEDVYDRCRPSVFVLLSLIKDKEAGGYETGGYVTAWAATADGVLVTNHHAFEPLDPGTVFGAADHTGNVYPLTDVLHADKVADVAVVKVDGKGFVPLPVAGPPRVGSWVGVLGHPDHMFYSFTQGHVSRYNANKTDGGATERWMSITADYATGSSGSPVLNRYGAVVGMAALTVNIDAPDEPHAAPAPEPRAKGADEKPRKPDPKPEPKGKPEPKEKGDPKPEPPAGSTLQMVVKMTVPAPELLKALGAEKP